MIDVRALCKAYGRIEAVRGVSFSVDTGEVVGLLGPNGAGKTTIMKVLTCFHFPSDGTAAIDGFDVMEDPLAVKSRIGYLPENAPLYGDLTVAEYLEFIADARGVYGSDRETATDRAIELCGLQGYIHRPIDQLSKGYRQRVGLAQAILHDPPVLILDEPTSGLDPNQIMEIRRLIRELGVEKTVILSTHILQEVEAVCDRSLILNEGRIVARGTTEQIGRELKGETSVTVEFRSERPIDTARLQVLGVVSDRRRSGEWEQVQLTLSPGVQSQDVYSWAVREGLIVRALVPRRVSLEEIFVRLTAGGEGGRQ